MTENTSSTKILIIEDEIAIAEGLIDLCNVNGYVVKHCADGESGLAEALTGQYNLVLLDLMLPGMDGFTVCDKIREKDRSLPIIILSAKNADDDIINGLKFVPTTTFRSRSRFPCCSLVLTPCSVAAVRPWRTKVSLLPVACA